jgi:hypothetical protein
MTKSLGRPADDALFIVFDTCTHPAYYGDLHELLALPPGAILRYEYKRYLFRADAATRLEQFIKSERSDEHLDALLMYGQKKLYSKGEADPATMLTWNDSVFVPTRSAKIVNAACITAVNPSDDKFHFHLQLRGFVDPKAPAIEDIVKTLEAWHALPFGDRESEYCWISILSDIDARLKKQLLSDDGGRWSGVVEKLMTLPTQFEKDIFWRIIDFREVSTSHERSIALEDRRSNSRGNPTLWNRDYRVNDLNRYVVYVETHSPESHGSRLPGGATLSLTSKDDDIALLRIPALPMKVVPNQVESTGFSISLINFFGTRHAAVQLETQTPGHDSPYPAGTLCSLSLAVSKQRWRVIVSLVLVIFVGIFATLTYGNRDNLPIAIPNGIGTAITAIAAFWVWRGEFSVPSVR